MKRRHLLLGLSLAALVASQAQAQVVTDIAPDGDAGFGTGTTVVTNGTQTQISGGELSGTNLFHSFAQFDLANGDTATWVRNAADANSITNVINRVRSGTPSNIDGTITIADMPNADFWFINPAGVVFGEGASVQVPNAAYFSTAQEIGFGGGQRFSTVTPDGSTFSSAPPQAFGFLGGQAAIGITGAMTTGDGAGATSQLNLVGADITVTGTLEGTGTSFGFAAVGSGAAGLLLGDLSQPVGNGSIEVRDGGSIIARADTVTGQDGGAIRLAASLVDIHSGGNVLAVSDGAGRAGDISINADFFSLSGNEISSINNGSGASGDIAITAQEFFMPGGAIFSEVYGNGQGGSVTVDTGRFEMAGGVIGTATYGALDSGDLTINAVDFIAANNAFLTTQAIGPAGGGAGTLRVSADTAQFFGGQATSVSFDGAAAGDVIFDVTGSLEMFGNGRIRSLAIGDGNAGDVGVRTGALFMTDGTQIVSVSTGNGQGGELAIESTSVIEMFGDAQVRSIAQGAGDGGDIAISAASLTTNDFAFVQSISFGDGSSGEVSVDLTGGLTLTGASFIESVVGGEGDAGGISISAAEALLIENTRIRSLQESQTSAGGAGDVSVNLTGDLQVYGNAFIESSTNGAGLAGDLSVRAANAFIFDNAYVRSNPFGSGAGGRVEFDIDGLLHLRDRGEIESATGGSSAANGGAVVISATELLMQGGEINSSSFGSGLGGSIMIDVDRATLDGGVILSSGFEDGDAGSVTVDVANQLDMRNFATIEAFNLGNGNAGAVTVRAGGLAMSFSSINADVSGAGDAGTIEVAIDGSIEMGIGAIIQSTTLFTGDAGNVRVIAGDTITMDSAFSSISAESFGAGDAGSVYVEAPTILMGQNPNLIDPGGQITSATNGSGNAGNVTVVADYLAMNGFSRINAATFGDGDAGTVNVSAGNMLLMDGPAQITADTLGAGNAGSVNVTAPVIEMYGNGRIASTTEGSGNGGTINVQTDNLFMTGASRIDSTARVSGSGNAGAVNVVVDGDLTMTQVAEIASNTESAGSGGRVSVSARDVYMSDIARLSSSTFGAGNAGSLTLTARNLTIGDNADIVSETANIFDLVGTGNAGSILVDIEETIHMSGIGLIGASTFTTGDAGIVTVRAGQSITMVEGAAIDSTTQDPLDLINGNSGSVEVFTPLLDMSGNASISARTETEGNAGSVRITADEVHMRHDSQVQSLTQGTGGAGSVILDIAGDLTLTDFAQVSASTRSQGDAGNVFVNAVNVDLSRSARISSQAEIGATGNAGSITLDVLGALNLIDQASIDAITFGPGDAGSVRVNADSVSLNVGLVPSDFSRISSNSEGSGDAGSVEVNARLVTVDDGVINSITTGSGDAGTVTINAVDFSMSRGFVSSTTQGEGNAGLVEVFADTVTISGGAINSTSQGAGDAGEVNVETGQLTMTGGLISSSVLFGSSGQGGNVFVLADSADLSGTAVINSEAIAGSTGNAGNVRVFVAEQLSMADDARIAASTRAAGVAGFVDVSADHLLMTGGSIESSTTTEADAGNVAINVTNAELLGDARITSNALAGSTGLAGKVLIEATGFLDIHDDAGIIAGTRGEGNAGLVSVQVGELFMDGGAIASSTEAAGDAGDVLISGNQIAITGDAKVNSGALQGSTGHAGFVQITTPNFLFVGGDAVISASTAGPGDAGAVLVTADNLQMNGGEIASFTRGAGNAGLVLIDAGSAFLDGGASINSLADGPNTGDAGDVFIKVARELVVANGATIAASTFGVGNAGEVNVTAGNIVLDGGQISSATTGSGDAGDVNIVADDLLLLPFSAIDSRSEAGASGDAGDVVVTVENTLRLEANSDISASSIGSGFAGLVEVRAGVLDMVGGAINSFTAGSGNAGLVGVFVGELNMSGGRIDSASDSPLADAGNAGSVFIMAGSASLSGDAQIDSRGITGDAGDVTLDVSGRLDISEGGQVSAATTGSGQAGLVQVFADELFMTGGAINSFTNGSGEAGLVDVTARVIDMSGGRIDSSSDSDAPDAGDAGGVLVRGNDVRLSGNALIDSRGITGDAGDVQVEVLGDLSMADEAQISAATDGSGDAGSVFVMADLLTMTGGEINSITTGSGDAGLVAVEVDELVMTGGRITSAAQNAPPVGNLSASIDPLAMTPPPPAGDAGDVFLRAGSALLDGAASIDSTSEGSTAGIVEVLVDTDLLLFNGAQISTTAFGAGDAGDITISANTVALDNFSQVSSTAARNFSAGTIEITAQEIRILNGSEISTNSENGPAGDIGLFLPQDGFLYLAGRDPGVITTSSGANTGGQIIISDPFLILSEGGSILALGQQGGANVQIQSAFFIRSSDRINLVSVDGSLLIESNVGEQITGTEVADIPFLDASGILSGQCTGVRQGGEVSQFSSRVTGPYAPPDTNEEAEDDMEGSSPDQIAQVEHGALAPCG